MKYYKKYKNWLVVVFWLALSYIICDTCDCTHNGDEPPKDCTFCIMLMVLICGSSQNYLSFSY